LRKLVGGFPPLNLVFRDTGESSIMASVPTRLDIEEVDGATIATFKDHRLLDEATIEVVGDQLFSLVDDHGYQKVVLDFSDVEYMSSSALGKLIKFHKKILAVDGSLRLCNLKPELQKIFKVLGLQRFFKIDKDRNKALKKI
jgi:anti-sigma B factor antagonist